MKTMENYDKNDWKKHWKLRLKWLKMNENYGKFWSKRLKTIENRYWNDWKLLKNMIRMDENDEKYD